MSIFTVALPVALHNFKALYKFLIIVSIAALLGAYATEFILKLPPCVLCWYQRYCYFLLVIFSATGLLKNDNRLIHACITVILISACLIAAYHASVERGFVKASEHCASQVKISDNLSTDEIKELLYNKPIATCEKAALKFIGLSMSEWNLLLNLGLLLMLYNVWKFKGKNHAKT